MLADVLTFKERETTGAGAAIDVDLLRKTIAQLHKDDNALLHYFGLDRQQLIQRIESNNRPAERCKESPLIVSLKHEVDIIESLLLDDQTEEAGQECFYWFYYGFYSYFRRCFEEEWRYHEVCNFSNVESLLVSIKSYVFAGVKRLSEKSLVHALNMQISENTDLDLQTFNQRLKTGLTGVVLKSYPVLTRLLIEHIHSTVAYLYKVIFHFSDDADLLQQAFSLPGKRIDAINLGLGDPHADGETVCSVHVGGKSLVYKPRSNHEALFYNALLKRLHELTGDDSFAIYAPITVAREGCCWIEKIENLACATEADLSLFYRRMGAQIAVVHALNGIDFHYENIIACGSSPVMIDLECLFTAAMVDLKINLPHTGALFTTLKRNSQSVFSSGFVAYSPDADNDTGGLTRQKIFISKKKQLIREQGFYRLKSVSINRTPVIRHLPIFKGEPRSVDDYQEVFFQGFDWAYEQVMNHIDAVQELIALHVSKLKTRVLIKNTQRYADFIELSLHPRFMQCMIQRELMLATLWSELNETLTGHHLPRYELNDLQKANIPCFTMPIGSSQIVGAAGAELTQLAIETPFDSCLRKLRALSSSDKAFQKYILRECLFPVSNDALPLNRKHRFDAAPSLDSSQYIEGAVNIAGVIERLCIKGEEGDVGWVFLNTHPRTRRKYISAMGNSLYNGIGGLAIFYLSLFRVSGQEHYKDKADEILRSMAKSHGHFDSDMTVSAYFGLASYVYVLVNYQRVTGYRNHQQTIDGLLLKLADCPCPDDEYDFLNGWCGTVTMLVNLYLLETPATLLPLINKLTEAIKSRLVYENGKFVLGDIQAPLLTGMSHGISGILHALAKVYEVTRDPSLVTLITQLLEAENCLTVQGFWLDLRDCSKQSYMNKWCHGDAGILISRLQLSRALENALSHDVRTAIEANIKTCESNLWEHGLGSGYSLCHGDFGNLVCLLELYRRDANGRGVDRVLQAFSGAVHNFFNEDFIGQGSIPDLGMMLGIAGVGQALLHAVDTDLPNVLSLQFQGAASVASVQDDPVAGSSIEPLQ